MKKGFTLIELLAVLVILAIIALIAVPIVLNIISDSKEESNKRSIEMYAKALENSIAKYQLVGKELGVNKLNTTDGRNFSNINDFKVDYEGNVVCEIIEVYVDGKIYLDKCKINDEQVEYTYGKKASFSNDSWDTIVANVKTGYMYNVGETKEVSLTGFPNKENETKYTVRIANNTIPSECSKEGFSQTACGFVIEFVDIITTRFMNNQPSSVGGWELSEMRKYVNSTIYNALPQKLGNNIIDTYVVSGCESGKTENYKTTDKLYLLATKEIWGDEGIYYDKAKSETRQLDYYKDVAKVSIDSYSGAIKKYNKVNTGWWLRSAYSSKATYFFHRVVFNGYSGDDSAKGVYGVAPAFRIG